MALVCRLELCVPTSSLAAGADGAAADGAAADGATADASSAPPAYLFPCLLPAATGEDVSQHWPLGGGGAAELPSSSAASKLVYRGHRFRASLGFLLG